ncbi:hypothetical protein EDD11_004616 [Mortierella claussenii]|nr:hypothetical protein EDD11_004616 [Mortierella claussenii]
MEEDTAKQEQQHQLGQHEQQQQQQQQPSDVEPTLAASIPESEPMEAESLQDATHPSKRPLSEDGDHVQEEMASSQPSTQSSMQPASQPTTGDESAAPPGSPLSANKKRRISMPGRSILKSASQDDSTDIAGNQEIPDETPASGMTVASESTETFSFTTEFSKRNRKSISRRVSFAATARIRMFERDEKEDELPKTMSFLEGLNPQVASNIPFTFGGNIDERAKTADDTNHTNDTSNSMASSDTGHSLQEPSEHTEASTGSSDSEKDFEVNVYSSTSDGTESPGTGTAFILPTSELDIGKTPFDDGDVDNGSSSEDDSNFFPDVTLMKRSSGVGLYQSHRSSILGPQVDMGLSADRRLSQASQNLDDGTQDYSMEYRFRKHRSSLPERLPAPLLQFDTNDLTDDFTSAQRYNGGESDASKINLAAAEVEDSHTNDFPSGRDTAIESQIDLSSNVLDLGGGLDLAMLDAPEGDDRSMVDEDTDMDITAPIGVGIQQLAQEMPPTAFHNAEDNTGIFSDLGTPMDITQPFGAGILEARDEIATDEIESDRRVSQSTSIPSTPIQSARSSLNFSDNNDNDSNHNSKNNSNEATYGQHNQGVNQKESDDSFRTHAPSKDPPSVPSTPPRRVSALRNDALSPISFPRRSLGTPGRFTPSVKARPNIFPEVLEKQLQTLESSTPREPIFRALHVSPETSNLAKRIYRYSTSSRTSGDFEGTLNEDQDDTLNFTSFEKRLTSAQASHNDDIHNERRLLMDTEMTDASVNKIERRPEESQQNDTEDLTQEIREAGQSEGGDEDSFTELPPITLSKFLGLVGISFLDHLNASTRRRTIPHRAAEAGALTETYRSADLVKAMAISMQELHSYREACRLLKQSIDTSRAFADEQERKVSKRNPEYFREFRESNSDTKEFMKDRFRMIKVNSKLDTNAAFSSWKTDVLKVEQESLAQHLSELQKDIINLSAMGSTLSKEKAKVLPRRDELRRHLGEATERQRSYELCDKEQLASLAEAAEEQGAQIEHYESVKAKKSKELAEIRARVEQLRLTERGAKARIAEAEKTIQQHQYVRNEDLSRAKDVLSIIHATHRWEPIQPIAGTSAGLQRKGNSPTLEFVYDKTLKVSIDMANIGKDPDAVQVSEFTEENMIDFDLSLTERPRLAISALASRKRKPIAEYVGLLRDFTNMVISKYKVGTAISKILNDISQFWQKVCLIRRDVELVRAHHVVDLVAGSAENLKELEENSSGLQLQKRQVAGSTVPMVVLDIRVRFTGPIAGSRRKAKGRRSAGEKGDDQDLDENEDEEEEEEEDTTNTDGHQNGRHGRGRRNGGLESVTEPVKFYLWFTFTLNDILNFPGPNSFTWRLELVYGSIRQDHVAQAVGPAVKKGGYDILRETCIKVNQLLRI